MYLIRRGSLDIMLCFLAYVIHHSLEIELIRKGLSHTVEKIREAIEKLEGGG